MSTVSREFQRLTERLLYRSLELHRYRCDSILKCILAITRTPRRAVLVRSISLPAGFSKRTVTISDIPIFQKLLSHALKMFANLKSLHIRRHVEMTSSTFHFYLKSWMLHGCTFRLHTFSCVQCNMYFECFAEFFSGQPGIQDWMFGFNKEIQEYGVATFPHNLLPEISTVEINDWRILSVMPSRPIKRLAIRTHYLDTGLLSKLCTALVRFRQTVTHLDIEMDGMTGHHSEPDSGGPWAPSTLIELLGQHLPELEYLQLSLGTIKTDGCNLDDVSQSISRMGSLKTFVIDPIESSEDVLCRTNKSRKDLQWKFDTHEGCLAVARQFIAASSSLFRVAFPSSGDPHRPFCFPCCSIYLRSEVEGVKLEREMLLRREYQNLWRDL